MKTFTTVLIMAFMLAISVFAFAVDLLDVDVPIQGFLSDPGGTPVPDGDYAFTFSIYDDPTAGNMLWTESKDVALTGGMWNEYLGTVNPIPDTAFLFEIDGYSAYLQIVIEGEDILPRTKLGATPYAGFARGLDGHVRTGPFSLQMGNEPSGSRQKGAAPPGLGDWWRTTSDEDKTTTQWYNVNGITLDTTSIETQVDDEMALIDVAFRDIISGDVSRIGLSTDRDTTLLRFSTMGNDAVSIIDIANIDPVSFDTIFPVHLLAARDTTLLALSASGENGINISDISHIDPVSLDTTVSHHQELGEPGYNMRMNTANITRLSKIVDDTISYSSMQYVNSFGSDTVLIEMQTDDEVAMVNWMFRDATIGDISKLSLSAARDTTLLALSASGDDGVNIFDISHTDPISFDTIFPLHFSADRDTTLLTLSAVGDNAVNILDISNIDPLAYDTISVVRTAVDGEMASVNVAFKEFSTDRVSTVDMQADNSRAILDVKYRATSDSSLMRFAADINGPSLTLMKDDGGASLDTTVSLGNDGLNFYDGGGIAFTSESRADTSFRVNTAGDAIFSGDVGFGTSTPAGPFHVNFSEGQGMPSNSSAGERVVITNNLSSSEGGGLEIISGSDGTAGVWFGDNVSVAQGAMLYHHDINEMRLIANATERMRIDNMGRVGINELDPSYTLDVEGDIQCETLYETSDGRYKKDVKEIEGALGKISKLRGVSFLWNGEEFPDKNFDNNDHVGFIAQDVRRVIPEIVSEGEDGYLSLDYGKLTPVLVQAVKELRAENDNLKARLAHLTSLVETILAENTKDKTTGKKLSAVQSEGGDL